MLKQPDQPDFGYSYYNVTRSFRPLILTM